MTAYVSGLSKYQVTFDRPSFWESEKKKEKVFAVFKYSSAVSLEHQPKAPKTTCVPDYGFCGRWSPCLPTIEAKMLMWLKILHSKICLLFLYLCASVYSLYSPGFLTSLYATKQEKEKKVYKVFENSQLSSICDSPRDLITNQQLCINSTNACARTLKKMYVYVCALVRVPQRVYVWARPCVRVCGELALSWRERASERGWEGKWKKTGSSWRPPPPLPTPRVEPHSASHLHCLAQPQSAKAIDF